jgi:hypothetical protein
MFFNLATCGDSQKRWVKDLIEPSQEDVQKGYKSIKLKNNKPRKFETQFIKECNQIKESIWDNNQDIDKALERDIKIGSKYLENNKLCEKEYGY